MKKFIFLSRNAEDAILGLLGGDIGYKNLGPEATVVAEETALSIPLIPKPETETLGSYKTDTITLTGGYVVEVDGKVIPLIFKPEDLSEFFNGANPLGEGLFIQAQRLTPTT